MAAAEWAVWVVARVADVCAVVQRRRVSKSWMSPGEGVTVRDRPVKKSSRKEGAAPVANRTRRLLERTMEQGTARGVVT